MPRLQARLRSVLQQRLIPVREAFDATTGYEPFERETTGYEPFERETTGDEPFERETTGYKPLRDKRLRALR